MLVDLTKEKRNMQFCFTWKGHLKQTSHMRLINGLTYLKNKEKIFTYKETVVVI